MIGKLIKVLSHNPMGHSKEFRRRRFFNWMPLGLMYSFYYMGRYNLAKANAQISDTFGLDNADIGIIITAGFWTYALSFLINGPLTDKFGGKKAIILGAIGTAIVNLLFGLLIGFGFAWKVVFSFSMLYSLNMYFQSFGAVSIVKVNSAWFHVSERGIFGGIFGILISLGYWLAYGVGAFILAHFPLMYVFIIPAVLIILITLIGMFVIKDKPSDAGFEDFDTADASSGEEDQEITVMYVFKKVFTNKIMVTIAFAEFTTGFIRNGIMQWFPKYTDRIYGSGHTEFFGLGLFLVGILGGMTAGIVSDKLFDSRRPPVAGLCYIGMLVGLLLLGLLGSNLVLPDTPAREMAMQLEHKSLMAAKAPEEEKKKRTKLTKEQIKALAVKTAKEAGMDFDTLKPEVKTALLSVNPLESSGDELPKTEVQIKYEMAKILLGAQSGWLYILATLAALLIAFFFIGTHGLLSGTASMDFGGRKAAGTAAGLIDGMVYFGSGFAGYFLGKLVDILGWQAWPFLLVPATFVGFFLTLTIWNAKPKGSAAH